MRNLAVVESTSPEGTKSNETDAWDEVESLHADIQGLLSLMYYECHVGHDAASVADFAKEVVTQAVELYGQLVALQASK